MKFTVNDVLKFLFPEWQIVNIIQECGFMAQTKKQDENVGQNYSNRPMEMNQYPVINSCHIAMSGKGKKLDDDKINEIFIKIRAELGNQIVGQITYLDSLCMAFKRPFVTGYDGIKPKNTIIVLGNKSTGKNNSISSITTLMKQNKLLSNDEVFKMELSVYATLSEVSRFIADLSIGLCGQGDILIFENFDQCHSSIIDVITALITTGRYSIDSRYVVQNKQGTTGQSANREISSNGKYFIFIAEKSEGKIIDGFGTEFIDSIGDIIHTGSFSSNELYKIAVGIITSFKKKCSQNLSLLINYDELVLAMIVANYKGITGINSMNDFVNREIYQPLAEYKLKKSLHKNEVVFISVVDDEFTVTIQNEIINLSDIMPRKSSSNIEAIKQELKKIIGIDDVKQYILSLEDNLTIQKMRESAGHCSASISMHMIFTGNPGTGKTTIARIVAKYLKALGILSSGQLREVTRVDLVGQYVGHTAKLTNDVIKSAIGGVLFIDEAYALCRDKHDVFGLEAIDALVKGIEDHRQDLVVILAGYKDEMNDLLTVNSGFKSRFPNLIHFEDYNSEEMHQISLITAQEKGYKISADCREPLIKLFDKKQIKGRNDSGNGRMVRNVIESAILNQSKRLFANQTMGMDLLLYDDFKFEEVHKFDLEMRLSQIIGLENVKDFIRNQYTLLIAQEKRKKAGIAVDTTQALNMIFSGNSGTGKTTIARIVAEMFKEMGLLKSGHLIETDRSGLVAEYVGQTATKTEEIFRSALGGVLFIDEAYALASENGSFGKEAIDILVKLIEDYRGEIIVIFAGYKKEMTDFLKMNSGLESRFPIKIDFPDYSEDELFRITLQMIGEKGFLLADGVESLLNEQIVLLHNQSNAQSGNGRMVRNYLEEITRTQSGRIAVNDIAVDEMNRIIADDIQPKGRLVVEFDLEAQLTKIIGLDEVKDYIRSLSARTRMQNERKKFGLTLDNTQTTHMIFKGNPGTGKTMVARTIAQVLHHVGMIPTTKLIETDRAGLVAGYVGQTAMKTREKIMEALDGVLFIDEAYSLSQGGPTDFGKEAIDTLVKMMDDYRERIIVVLAGYSQDMDEFIMVNPGLKSRFPNVIEFVDYSVEQLIQIAELFFQDKGYELEPQVKYKLHNIFMSAKCEPQFGNGRYVRNLFEKAVNNQAMRLSAEMHLTKENLITIIDADIEKV